MSTETYDAIVIGAGQAGGPLSTALAKAGLKTAIVERKHVGGTCVNEGCTPTKTMVASARVAYLARRAADFGVQTGAVAIDMEKIRQRKREIVQRFRQGSRGGIESTEGSDLLMGEASFTGPQSVEVRLNEGGRRQLSADRFFINTGARPAVPSIMGIEDVPILNSTTIMELAKVPDHLLIVGGGYIGVEFGQMFRRFGSRVTMVQRREQLLTREDKDVAEEVAGILQEDGIDILFNAAASAVKETDDGSIQLAVRTSAGERTLTGSHLLVAAGRIPNTNALNLEAAGVETDQRGYIVVDDRLQTNVSGIYALGDVKGGPAFTHISYDDFRILRTNLIEGGDATIRDRIVPYVVYMDPELGRVGLSEAEAANQGYSYQVAKLPMSHVARALESDETRGFMKALVETETDRILGVAILGVHGGEIMSVLQVAMMGRLPYTAIKEGVFAHPTLTESLNNLFMTLDG